MKKFKWLSYSNEIDSVLFMLELVNYCNSIHEQKDRCYIWYDSEIDKFRIAYSYVHFVSIATFNSEDSFYEGLKIIESNDEYTKLVKVFLGLTNDN